MGEDGHKLKVQPGQVYLLLQASAEATRQQLDAEGQSQQAHVRSHGETQFLNLQAHNEKLLVHNDLTVEGGL